MIKKHKTLVATLPTITRKGDGDMSFAIPRINLVEKEDTNIPGIFHRNNTMDYTMMEHNKLIRNIRGRVPVVEGTALISKNSNNEFTGIKTWNEASRIKACLSLIQLSFSQAAMEQRSPLLHGIWLKKGEGVMYDLYMLHPEKLEETPAEYVNILDFEDTLDESQIIDLRHYSVIGTSPSGERRSIVLLGDDTIDWDGIINDSTEGFLELNRGEKTYQKLAKESSKLYQCLAGSVNLGKIRKIAIYYGKFDSNKFDGMCWGDSKAFCDRIFESKGVKIEPSAVNGMFTQERIAQGKYGKILTTGEILDAKIKKLVYDDESKIIKLTWDQIQDELIKKMIGVKGTVVIIGAPDAPIDVLLDDNTLKSIYDLARQPEYTLLRILKDDSPVHFSSTIFVKGVTKNRDLSIKTAEKLYQYALIDKLQAQLKSEGRILGLETFDQENIFLRDVLVGAFPEYARRDKNVAYDTLENIIEGANKMVGKLHIPVYGGTKGLIVGPECLRRHWCALEKNEVYNSDFERMFTKMGIPESEWKIFFLKYPSMDEDEYDIYNVVSLKTIKKRLRGKIHHSEVDLLIKEYSQYRDSVMVIPCNEEIKSKHAGLDFDTDMAACIPVLTDAAMEVVMNNHDLDKKEKDRWRLHNNLYHIYEHEEVIVEIAQ